MVGAVSESAALWHLLGQWFHGIFLKSCQRTSHQPQAVLLEWETFLHLHLDQFAMFQIHWQTGAMHL